MQTLASCTQAWKLPEGRDSCAAQQDKPESAAEAGRVLSRLAGTEGTVQSIWQKVPAGVTSNTWPRRVVPQGLEYFGAGPYQWL